MSLGNPYLNPTKARISKCSYLVSVAVLVSSAKYIGLVVALVLKALRGAKSTERILTHILVVIVMRKRKR